MKKNTKSLVWREFRILAAKGKIINSELDSAICQVCGDMVNTKGSNTTNPFQYLCKHHPSVSAELASCQVATKKQGKSSNNNNKI